MAWYRTGTIAVTNGSTTVTGTGTAFVANVSIGEAIVAPDGRSYEITAVVSDTQLTLANSYLGATSGGQAYAIFPTASFARDLALQAATLLGSFADVRDGVGEGLFPDGSVATPALRFVLDQDSGFYRAGANLIGVAVAGVLRAVFGSAGVGIGTSSPQNLLHVLGDAAGGDIGARLHNNSSTAGASATLWLTPSTALTRGAGVRGVAENVNVTALAFLTNQSGLEPTERLRLSALGHLYPTDDNTRLLGQASNRWNTVYAGSGTINTSDEREKQQIGAVPVEWLDAWGEVQWQRYKFNDAVEEKGDAAARWHIGLTAQSVHAAFDAHGVDAFAIGLCCFDEWDDELEPVLAEVTIPAVLDENGDVVEPERTEWQPTGEMRFRVRAGDRWGLRYEECFAIEMAWQRRRMAQLEARLEALGGA